MTTNIPFEKKSLQRTFFQRNLNPAYRLHLLLFLLFLVWAFITEDPRTIFSGLLTIIKSPDILITDYVELTNFAAVLVNSGLYGLICIFILHFLDVSPNGGIIMALWMTTGFAFFGKNILNIWPPMFGVYLYAKMQKQPLKNYVLNLLLSTTVSPIVTHFVHSTNSHIVISMLAGVFFGILGGFLLSIIAPASVKLHNGYSLYNIGFAAGIIMTVFVSVLQSFGYTFQTTNIWAVDQTMQIAIFIYFISLILIFWGVLAGLQPYNIRNLKYVFTHSGRLISDYYLIYRETAYINMGLLGIFACTVSLLLGLDLNGPILGAIFTIIGFGAFGKHVKNVWPIILGAVISSFLNKDTLSSSGNALSILFSTSLAPIAGQFGPFWGIVAGFLHVAMSKNIGRVTGGLNLYNNGFTAAFVAFFLVPIILTFRKDKGDFDEF